MTATFYGQRMCLQLIELLKKASFFIAIGFVIVLFLFLTRDEAPIETSTATSQLPEDDSNGLYVPSADDAAEGILMIDVKGAVAYPGVYEIHTDARINNAIEMAGGFADDADQSQVNLAQKVQDEMVILIPRMDEETEMQASNFSGNAEGKVRINYATQEEIESLPGIGPSKAQAILKHREEHGLFQSAEDLLHVTGIGEKTLENLRDHLQLP